MSRVEFKLPDLGEGTVSSEIVQWRVAEGERIVENAPLVELATEKAVVEVTSPVTGQVVSLHGKPGEHMAVGAVLVTFETNSAATDAPTPTSSPTQNAPAALNAPVHAAAHAQTHTGAQRSARATGSGRVMCSPVTRRLAKEAGIDLTQVTGSGPQGRIERRDIAALLQGMQPPGATPATPASASTAATVATAKEGLTRAIPVIGVRRVIAQRMLEAVRTIPHITYVEEVDLTAVDALRQKLNQSQAVGTPSFTLLPFFIQALCEVIRHHPRMNAHYNAANETIEEYAPVHVGLAAHTPDGLKVPVLRDAEQKTLEQLRDEIAYLSERARTGQAKRAELTGSTITISSLGKLGGVVSTPLINSPELAIIGLNQAKPAVVVRDGQMVIRLMMNLSSSFDHRFIDGYDAARFIQDLKLKLESPKA